MADQRRGKWLSLSPARRVVDEILRHARKVPSLPVAKRCRLAAKRIWDRVGAFRVKQTESRCVPNLVGKIAI